jgi:hypothetical protein
MPLMPTREQLRTEFDAAVHARGAHLALAIAPLTASLVDRL